MDYKQSGVDVDAGNEVVRRIRGLARGTFTSGVLSELGSFGGLFRLGGLGFRDPVLVASADGVGTKLRVAFMAGVHETVGVDLVNHCVNDILVQGAEPLFFLDYLATGRLDPDVAVTIVEGLARACRENGCALLGGETAEMPGFYGDGEYDLAGFVVGAVEREHLIDGSRIMPGDVLIGLPSSGLHTNGYSLARRIVFDRLGLGVRSHVAALGASVGDALLVTHRSYLPLLRPLLTGGRIKGMAHITGGGITDNLPRILPPGTEAHVRRAAWSVPPVFRWLQAQGRVSDEEMLRTFNMGIGLIVVVAEGDAESMTASLGSEARAIGRVTAGQPRVVYDAV
ncbi:MAG TPA: phosphoribosylformylglycinamidine cyclo-ligase [Vicinamibacterales bacterium]|nr:phosphoribosylformylglycinamidine cyclo-ligase [Vicinamibacterales bacterium]